MATENPAELFTKHLGVADMWKHLATLHMSPEEGRTSAVHVSDAGDYIALLHTIAMQSVKMEPCGYKSLLAEAIIQPCRVVLAG